MVDRSGPRLAGCPLVHRRHARTAAHSALDRQLIRRFDGPVAIPSTVRRPPRLRAVAAALAVLTLVGLLNRVSSAADLSGVVVDAVDFDRTVVGRSSAPQAVEVTAADVGEERISSISTSSAEFDVVSDLCSGQALSGDERCVVSVAFRPGGGGTREGRLRLLGDQGITDELVGVSLRGTGLPSDL